MKEMEGKKVPVVREMVRINHHRNCLLCHAPAVIDEVSDQVTSRRKFRVPISRCLCRVKDITTRSRIFWSASM